MLLRMLRGPSRALQSWVATWQETVQTQQAMRQVLGRMINSKTSRAWESWQAMIRGRMDALRAPATA